VNIANRLTTTGVVRAELHFVIQVPIRLFCQRKSSVAFSRKFNFFFLPPVKCSVQENISNRTV